MANQSQTRYAKSGDLHIAYQVMGDGPFDLIVVPGWVSHLEYGAEEPELARFYQRLASFCRVIMFDKRGTGLSDRVAEFPTLEERMDDVRAIMDEVGSEKAAILGMSEGGSMSCLFAATYPERTLALVGFGVFAKRIWDPEYPWAPRPEERQKFFDSIEQHWGEEANVAGLPPSRVNDDRFRRWFGRYLRTSASPGAALTLARGNTNIDIRHILPAIRVPTLILHRTGDQDANVEEGRYIAGKIPGAKFVELPGADHIIWLGDVEKALDEVQEFLTGKRQVAEPDRVLATVLFTDIVDSTKRAVELGDRKWRDLLAAHEQEIRTQITAFRGRAVKNTGDGFLAIFDGPARAIRCACAISENVRQLGIEVRAGLHSGEIELIGDDVGGIGVHIASRVLSNAGSGEVWASSTVKELVAGSNLQFVERGMFAFKGILEPWRLFSVLATASR